MQHKPDNKFVITVEIDREKFTADVITGIKDEMN
jgi:hypothetical protein